MEVGSYTALEKQVRRNKHVSQEQPGHRLASTMKHHPISLHSQIQQLDSQSAQSVQSVGTLYVMKSRLLKDDSVDTLLKSGPLDGQQREDMFHEVRPHPQNPQATMILAHLS